MYTFVLEWTPALTPPDAPSYHAIDATDHSHLHTLAAANTDEGETDDGHRGAIPHGFIFAAFMVN